MVIKENENLDKVAWYDENSKEESNPVSQKKPKRYGIYDMNGNVAELLWDPYGYDSGNYDLIIGGSFKNDSDLCRIMTNYYYSVQFDEYYSLDNPDIGFRIVHNIKK